MKLKLVLVCPRCKNDMIILNDNTNEAYCPKCDFLTYNYMKEGYIRKRKDGKK